jgi:creatinine amidohydrolase
VRRIVVVNGHGGNLAALSEMARELREEDVFVSVFQWWPAAAKLLPELFSEEERRHAAAEETSMNLVLHPKLVDMKKTVDEKPQKSRLQMEGMTLPFGTVDETASGAFGKTSTASAAKGKKVFEAVVRELAKHVRLLKEAKLEDLLQKPKV